MSLLAALSGDFTARAAKPMPNRSIPVTSAIWVPQDETEAMDQILNVSDPEAFEAAGRYDGERLGRVYRADQHGAGPRLRDRARHALRSRRSVTRSGGRRVRDDASAARERSRAAECRFLVGGARRSQIS